MIHQALTGNFGAGTTGMTLQQAVFAGLVDPGNIFIVRELLSNPGPGDLDTALFSGASADYTITANPNGSVTVAHTAALGGGGGGGVTTDDGTDTLWNIELLAFTDGTFPAPANPCKTLALGHTGSGSDPIANPANSAGCAAGSYLPGQSISVSGAVPAAGFQISGWTGTNNNASTAATNTVTMPVTNHSVTVNYVDSVPVVVSSTLVNASPTNRTNVFFTVTFSESVTGVNAPDFSLTTTGTIAGAFVSGVTGTGSTRSVNVNTGTGDGTIRLNVADNNSIIDSASNPLGGPGLQNFTTGQTYTVDKTAPTVLSITRNNPNPLTNGASVTYLVTFSESVRNIVVADFSPNAGAGISGAAVTATSGTGATRFVVVGTGSGDGTLAVDLIDRNTILDTAGNVLGGAGVQSFTTGQAYTVDKTVPVVSSITLVNPNPTVLSQVQFLVTFSESVTGVNNADFLITRTGTIAGTSIASTTGTGATRTVTVNTGTGSGTIRLDVRDDDTIRDATTNRLGGTGINNGAYSIGPLYNVR
jgi:hypothetical protein